MIVNVFLLLYTSFVLSSSLPCTLSLFFLFVFFLFFKKKGIVAVHIKIINGEMSGKGS